MPIDWSRRRADTEVGMLHILCRLFGHHRSKRWARPTADGWRSECVRCGERLVRVAPKQWQPVGAMDEH